MKLGKLTMAGWAAFDDATIDLSRPLTFVQGRNGAGKTSIRDAVIWGLSGLDSKATDAGGKHAAKLIRRGAKKAIVSLETSWGLVRRGVTGTGAVKAEVPAEVSWDKRVLFAALHPRSVLEMGEKEQAAIWGSVLALRMPAAEAATLAPVQAVPEAGIHEVSQRLDAAPGGVVTREWMAEQYAEAYEARRDVKRSLDALRSALAAVNVVAPTQDAILAATAAVSEAKVREDGARRSLESHRVAAQTEAEIRTIEGRIKAERGRSSTQGTLGLGAEQAPGARASLDAAMAAEKQAIEAKAEARVAMDEARAELARAQASGSNACDGRFGPETTCPLAKDAVTRDQAKARVLAAHEAVDAARAIMVARTAAAERAGLATVKAHTAAVAAVARETADLGAMEARLTELRKIPTFATTVDDAMKALAQESEVHRRAIAAHATLLERATAATRSESMAQRVAAEERRHAALDAVCDLFEPRGLPSAMFQAVAGPMLKKINGVAAKLLPGYVVKMNPANGGLVITTAAGELIDTDTLSESELFRVSIGIGAAISAVVGLGVVLIDEEDTLDEENRAALWSMAQLLAPLVDHVIVFGTRVAPDARATHWIEGGAIKEV